MAFVQLSPETGNDIWIYSRRDDSARAVIAGPEREGWPVFSPHGNWLAFERGDALRDIWVTPFPGPGPECKVSKGGGNEPHWSRDGTELFYRSGSTAMVADVRARDFCRAKSRALFDGLEEIMWTVAPDGSFFVTVQRRPPPRLWLVQNWFAVLQRPTEAR